MDPDVKTILNFLEISDTLGTAGQPAAGQFAAIREAGYEVVINLAMPASSNAVADEAERVRALGMEYVPIPVVWESPQPEDLDAFFKAMDRHAGQRVFVHCAMNMRVSAFVLLYRVIRQGVPLEVAREAMRKIWEPNETWARFIGEALGRNGLEAGG
jgi:protein tyrosine phosphatase (PTP) superfamily phosphohydrolase (DUF442 family)